MLNKPIIGIDLKPLQGLKPVQPATQADRATDIGIDLKPLQGLKPVQPATQADRATDRNRPQTLTGIETCG